MTGRPNVRIIHVAFFRGRRKGDAEGKEIRQIILVCLVESTHLLTLLNAKHY